MANNAQARLSALFLLLCSTPNSALALNFPKVALGECIVASDPEAAPPKEGQLCVNSRAGTSGLWSSNAGSAHRVTYFDGYTGFHPSPWISFHLAGFYRAFDHSSGEVQDRDLDLAAIRLGNPALNKLRVLVGKQNISFGAANMYRNGPLYSFYKRRYWEAQSRGLNITYDDFRSNIFELSILETTSEQDQVAGLRLAHDFTAVTPTRLILSYSRIANVENRTSVALVSSAGNGGESTFEWIRISPSTSAQFLQILRFHYAGPFQNQQRTIVGFDETRHVDRNLIVAQEFKDDYRTFHYGWGWRRLFESEHHITEWNVVGGLGLTF